MEWCGSNHYIQEAPEVVKAVLNTLQEPEMMLEMYLNTTQGCLVHFQVPCTNTLRLGHGLIYLCDKRHCALGQQYLGRYGLESMEGVTVSFEDILKVEFLP